MKTISSRTRTAAVAVSILGLGVTGCAKYKQKIADQSTVIAKLEDENALLREQKGQAEGSNAACATNAEELEAENSSLEEAKAALEAELAEARDRIKALESELKSLDTGKEELSKELADKKQLLREVRKKEAQAKRRLATVKEMLSKFKSLIEAGKLDVRIKRGKMVVALPSAVLFESGDASLSEEGKATLGEVAKVLAKIRGREFQVAGHTDTVPIKSANYKSNWELSTARAVNVVQFLQDHGVKPKNLSAAGYSQYQPDASNKTEKGRAENRRIEITLMPNLEELPDLSDLKKELKK